MTADGGDPGSPAGPTLGVAAVARRLGVATGTLRTWDRRYGVGPSAHQPGSRRQYSPADLARLEAMHRLMLEGFSAAEAARAALDPDTARSEPSARAGGGRVVAMPDASPAARGLARAAVALDATACDATLEAALLRQGVLEAWERLVSPVLARLEERRRATGHGLAAERLLAERAEAAVRATGAPAPVLLGLRPVVLAGVSDESRRVPLVVIEAALAQRGVPVRLLGPRLPVRALGEVLPRIGPSVVLLWSQQHDGAAPVPSPDLFARVRARPLLVLAGPGYRSERFHAGTTWAPSAADAVGRVLDRLNLA
jgi:DNA-binding transcriptional MerR regulator